MTTGGSLASAHLDGALTRRLSETPAYLEDLAQWADAAVELFPVHGERFQEIARVLRAGAAQAALNPGMREALERIRDFPVGGHTAAGAMALIARQALASQEINNAK